MTKKCATLYHFKDRTKHAVVLLKGVLFRDAWSSTCFLVSAICWPLSNLDHDSDTELVLTQHQVCCANYSAHQHVNTVVWCRHHRNRIGFQSRHLGMSSVVAGLIATSLDSMIHSFSGAFGGMLNHSRARRRYYP